MIKIRMRYEFDICLDSLRVQVPYNEVFSTLKCLVDWLRLNTIVMEAVKSIMKSSKVSSGDISL